MTYTTNDIFVDAYNAMKHHLASQEGSKLKGLFEEQVAVHGEKHFFDRIGNMSVDEITGLNEPIVLSDAAFSRRMATIADFEKTVAIGSIEKAKLLVDPTNDIVRKLKGAHNRNYDSVLFYALLGSAATGRAGAGSAATFDSNNVIAHGSTGVTLAKFLEALRILEEGDVDTSAEDIYCFLPPRAKEDLLAITNFTSTDFQLKPTLAGKMLPQFRGIFFIESNLVPEIDATNFRAIMCSSSSLKVAKRAEPIVKIDQRIDLKDQPYQIYTQSSVGAVRMEEALVVDIRFQ